MIPRFSSSVFRTLPAWNRTWFWRRTKADGMSFRPHLIVPLVLMCNLLTTAEISDQGNHVVDDAWVLTGKNQDQDANFAPVIANGFMGSVIPALGSAYKNQAGRHMLDGYYVGATPKEVKVPIQRWNCISFNNGVNDCAPKVGQLSDYQQQLNLRQGTVETWYRWTDSGKSADIRIVSFASRNEPNLAVIRYAVTPGFDGPAAFKVALDGRDSGSRITSSGEANQVIWMLDSVGQPTNLEAAAAIKAVFTGCEPELKKTETCASSFKPPALSPPRGQPIRSLNPHRRALTRFPIPRTSAGGIALTRRVRFLRATAPWSRGPRA